MTILYALCIYLYNLDSMHTEKFETYTEIILQKNISDNFLDLKT